MDILSRFKYERKNTGNMYVDKLSFIVLLLVAFATYDVAGDNKIPDECLLPLDPGLCLSLIPRWGYVSSSNQCEKFTYSGCKGNANRFTSLEDCMQTCMPTAC